MKGRVLNGSKPERMRYHRHFLEVYNQVKKYNNGTTWLLDNDGDDDVSV